ncbi:hypothetical protein B0H19DRAFT_1115743 [Mycena capillaripes]|nr:hypothetical protein B0H19DRAFT_1115743 [Mycena capillaripes]
MLLDKQADKGKSELSSSSVEIEEPPPYSVEHGSSRSRPRSELPPLPVETRESPVIEEAGPSFSQIRLDTRFHDITGTYYVDPKNPISELTNKNKKPRKKAIPDAIFRTRSAKITIALATTGIVHDVPKASVIVTSKSGNITLNLLPADETRPRFDLDVRSNSGKVVVFIPKTYGGAIQLQTKSGHLEFLPALSEYVHVVKSQADQESLVLCGKQPTPSSQLPSDFCHIRTRSGKIIVGLRGEDKYVEELGLWQRIFGGKADHHDTSTP